MKKRQTINFKLFSKWLVWLLFLPSLLLNFYLFQQNKKLEQGIEVMAVLDGDTLLLDGKVRLRLRQVDAPELDFCGGPEAKKLLEELVKDKKVVLQEYILDQYGRPMALVYQGNKFINKEMIKSGWVRYHHDNTPQTEDLKEVSEQIKQVKILRTYQELSS